MNMCRPDVDTVQHAGFLTYIRFPSLSCLSLTEVVQVVQKGRGGWAFTFSATLYKLVCDSVEMVSPK